MLLVTSVLSSGNWDGAGGVGGGGDRGLRRFGGAVSDGRVTVGDGHQGGVRFGGGDGVSGDQSGSGGEESDGGELHCVD